MVTRMTLALALAATTFASPSLAGVGLELFGGARDGKMAMPEGSPKKEYAIKGTEFGGVVSFSPRMLPFQVGVIGATYTMDSTKAYEDQAPTPPAGASPAKAKGTITGLHYGLVARAWLPLGFLAPYAEAGYLMGNQTEKISFDAATSTAAYGLKVTDTYKTQGPIAGLGLRIAPLPLFAVSIGYEMAMEKRTLTKTTYKQTLTAGGSTATDEGEAKLTSDDKKARDFVTGAVRLGFSLGF